MESSFKIEFKYEKKFEQVEKVWKTKTKLTAMHL